MRNLGIDEDSEFIDQEALGKKETRDNIIRLLRDSKYGRNLSQIADRLEMSRNTVKKYIKTMVNEDLVVVKEIGRSKIAYLKDNYEGGPAKGYIAYVLDFYNAILLGVRNEAHRIPDIEDVLKSIGKEMGKHIMWPPVEVVTWDKKKKPTLTEAVKILNELVALFNAVFNIVQLELIPPISDDELHAIMRVENVSTRVEDTELFFHISSGFFETKMSLVCGHKINLNVIEYRMESACCYLKLEIP